MFCIDPLNFDVTTSNVGTKMMVLDCSVFGARTHFGSLNKLHTTFIIFEDGDVFCFCSRENNLSLKFRHPENGAIGKHNDVTGLRFNGVWVIRNFMVPETSKVSVNVAI